MQRAESIEGSVQNWSSKEITLKEYDASGLRITYWEFRITSTMPWAKITHGMNVTII